MSDVPEAFATPRLTLRAWRPTDADPLATVLDENVEHLTPWIPAAVARPDAPEALAERLAGYADDFAAARTWRWAVRAPDGAIIGQASLHPRDAAERVAYESCDRIELGYWLAAARTGQGYATEAAGALCQIASRLTRPRLLEMYIDAHNERSRRVASRLMFERIESRPMTSSRGDVGSLERWVRRIERSRTAID